MPRTSKTAAALNPAEDDDFAQAMIDGLSATPKTTPCKYLYDERGSELFEDICSSPEYYVTRTELDLLRRHAGEIGELIGPDAELIEFGAGSGRKVRLLLDAMTRPRAYLPIDISHDYLEASAARLRADYPGLKVHPVTADFTQPHGLPALTSGAKRRVGFFPGSTIGNLTHEEAEHFLARASRLLKGGALLIGVDLVKDPAVLHAAYNDGAGHTAAFNKNLLARANRELGTDFDLGNFHHHACYNPVRHRVEMYLISATGQRVTIGEHTIAFTEGEAIHTENSHKHTVDGFRWLATKAGFKPGCAWLDPAGLFSMHWLEAA